MIYDENYVDEGNNDDCAVFETCVQSLIMLGLSLFSLDPQCDPHVSPNTGVQCHNSSLCGTHVSPNTAFLNVLYNVHHTTMCFVKLFGHLQYKYTVWSCLLCSLLLLARSVHCASIQAVGCDRGKHGIGAFSHSQISNCWLFVSEQISVFSGGLCCPIPWCPFSQKNSFFYRTFTQLLQLLVENFLHLCSAFIVLFVIHCVLRDCYSSVLCFIVFECCWSAWCGWAPSSPGDWSKCGALYD